MPILKAPDTISASTTAVRTTLPESKCWYTIYNDCAGSAYYIADPTLDDGDLIGTAAVMRALGASEIKTKGAVAFFADAPWIDITLPTGGVSGNVYINAGMQVSQVNVEANLGNVGLLDSSETEIDPAIKSLQLERHLDIDEVDSVTGWAAAAEGGYTKAENIATTTDHIPHDVKLLALEFDKAAGDAEEAKIEKTLLSIDASGFEGPTILRWAVKHANFTNVEYLFVRIGKNTTNYVEYQIVKADLTIAKWNVINTLVSDYDAQSGTGLQMSDIDYLAFGIVMDATGDSITNVQFEEVEFLSSPHVFASPPEAELIVDNNVNLLKLRGTVIARNAGNVGNDTLRVAIASDDILLSAILASLGSGSLDVDLDKVTQSKKHTHTTAGSAESIAGDAAFTAGATLLIIGLDTWVAVGDDVAQAQGGDVKFAAGVPFTMQLDGTEVTFHLDAASGGEVSIHQVS